MKEGVSKTSHPWVVGAVVAAMGGAYFYFMGTGSFTEPGLNLEYDITEYEELDNIETRFDERAAVDVDLESPYALATSGDTLYVGGEGAIVKIDGAGVEVARFSVAGRPNCLHVAQDGTIFVGHPKHVEVLNASGESQATWSPFNARSFVTAIATWEDDVYVGDAGNRVVLRYNRDGEWQTAIGAKDEKRDIPGIEVPSPYLDLAVNDEGHLWVVNPGKLGLERYRENGDIVTSWYHPHLRLDGFSGCCNPIQIAFAPDGRLITGEKGLVRVKAYEVTAGTFEELMVGSRLFQPGQSIRDLAVDAQGRVYVIDAKTEAIRVFALKDGAPEEGNDGSAVEAD